jgi:hypothetical protein
MVKTHSDDPKKGEKKKITQMIEWYYRRLGIGGHLPSLWLCKEVNL